MKDLNLTAHSRDQLDIVYENNTSFVRKTFFGDIARARKNISKQDSFKTLHTGQIKISGAPVVSFASNERTAELQMQFIEGITGHEFAVHAGRTVATNLSTALSTMLYAEMAESTVRPLPTRILLEKFDEILDKTTDTKLRWPIEQAKKRISAYPETMNYPIGQCHGDLTLSNMIFHPVDGLVLIDFLDTFLESPLQDIAKLKQDFTYGWSFRKSPSAIRLKGSIFCATAYPKAIIQIEELYSVQIYALTILVLARIAPYVNDDLTAEWLIKSLTICLGEEGLKCGS